MLYGASRWAAFVWVAIALMALALRAVALMAVARVAKALMALKPLVQRAMHGYTDESCQMPSLHSPRGAAGRATVWPFVALTAEALMATALLRLASPAVSLLAAALLEAI